jgi:hypothetical protein
MDLQSAPGGAHNHGRQEDGGSNEREPWERLLVDAAPRDHIVQLYQDPHAPSAISPPQHSPTVKA